MSSRNETNRPAVSVPGVTLTMGPQDWTILQRDREGFGHTEVAGTWSTKETDFQVQVRVVHEATQAPAAPWLDWQDAEVDLSAGVFKAKLERIPQGGLYRVESRIRRPSASDPRAMRGDCIHHLGVGDLYVIAGQSNASGTGKGSVTDGPMLGVHLFANDEQWKLATHPIEDATGTLHPVTITGVFHGHSPWLAFGRILYSRTGIPVGLIPAARGGSRISRWTGPGQDLFDNMADMIAKAGGEVAGVVWYQGESDTRAELLPEYEQAFRSVVSSMRKLVEREDLPIFIGQLSRHITANAEADSHWSLMRQMQRKASLELDNVHLIVTADCSLSDEIHLNSASTIMVGERFAEAALSEIYGLPVAWRHPSLASIGWDQEGRVSVRLQFENLSGDWTPISVIRDFTVEDARGFLEIEKVRREANNDIILFLARPAEGDVTVHGLYGANPQITLKDDQGRCMEAFSVRV